MRESECTVVADAAESAAQGEVLVYVLPGMFVPNAAQSMQTVNGKRAVRFGLFALLVALFGVSGMPRILSVPRYLLRRCRGQVSHKHLSILSKFHAR